MTTEWAVDVTYELALGLAVEDKQLEVLSDRFDELDWTVSSDPDGFLTISGHCDDPDMALLVAAASVVETGTISLTEMGIDARPVKVAIRSAEEVEREARMPEIPELLAASDIARLLGVSRQRVTQLRRDHEEFPPPVVATGAGHLWTREAVDWFAGVWDRRPGRRTAPGEDTAPVVEREPSVVTPFRRVHPDARGRTAHERAQV